MEANKAIAMEGLKWRCKTHPNMPGDIICLDGDSKDRVMCFRCLQVNQVPLSNLIQMGCILGAKGHDIFENYPPLKDQKLSDRLKQVGLQQSIDEIDLYFKKLREDCEREINAAQQRAKQILIKSEQAKQQILESYTRIAEIQKLKQLIVSNKEGAEKDLDEFIKDKWKKAEENKRILQDLMKQYDSRQYFSSIEPNKVAQIIIVSLKSINFFAQSIQQEFIKLNKKLYVLEIEVDIKPGNNWYYFFAGIVKDEGKDTEDASDQKMSYSSFSDEYGITRYIKGYPNQSRSKLSGKHSFEIRIHLAQKLLKVASLPDYSSIAELDDPNKIDPKVNYRFFLSLFYQGDIIRINNVNVVDEFDQKM